MIKCARLTLQLREVIENMHADGYVQEAIAAAVGVDQSTVSRELRRRPGAYAAGPFQAQAQSRSRIPTTVRCWTGTANCDGTWSIGCAASTRSRSR